MNGVIVLLAGILIFGPREPIDETITFDSAMLGSDLDEYLDRGASKIPDLIPGTAKQIIWQDPEAKTRTPYSIVFLHGFSATSEELRPLPDLVADRLGANLFYTRLRGHGRPGAALSRATANDWYNDTAEALAIARLLGEKVIVIGSSTGGTLAAWAAFNPQLMDRVAGLAMVSANFGINNAASVLLTLGGARIWVPWIVGEERSFDTHNAGHAKWWTTSYPTVALLPMMAVVTHANQMAYEEAQTPALFVYHPEDKVVRSDVTRDIAGRWGRDTSATSDVVEITQSQVDNNHVIAGRILNPDNTEPIADHIVKWVETLPH